VGRAVVCRVGVTRPRRGRKGPGSYPAGYASCIIVSIVHGRGDVETRFILLLSADACAIHLCKQGLVAGPRIFICDECINLCFAHLPLRSKLTALAAMFSPWNGA
jgi:hypothetical protein